MPKGQDGSALPGTNSRQAAVVAPELMVLAIILCMGDLGFVDEPGAHVRPRSRRRRLLALLGVHRRSARGRVRLGIAFVLRGRGGGWADSGAAQGGLFTEAQRDQA
jgi:hypothetical protein